MAQVIADVVKVDMRYNVGEQSGVVENTYYVRAGGINDALLDLLYEEFFSWESEWAAPLRSADCQLKEIILTDMGSLDGPRQVHSLEPDIPGTVESPILPPNVTVAIHSSIGTRGRGKSGRKFWIGLCESQITQASVNSVVLGNIVIALNHLRDGVAEIPDVECLCVPHLVVGGVRPPVAGSDCVVRFSASDRFVDSQKLRLPEHKKHKKPRP